MSVAPAINAQGDSERSPPEYAYLHLLTAIAASSGVSICGKMIPAAPTSSAYVSFISKTSWGIIVLLFHTPIESCPSGASLGLKY
jgi:hypothetical protein